MVDLLAITQGAMGLKTAGDIAKTLVGLRDSAKLLEQSVELKSAASCRAASAGRGPRGAGRRSFSRYAHLKKKLLALKAGKLRSRNTS